MTEKPKDPAAVALGTRGGKNGKGKPKTLTEAQRQERADRMKALNERRRAAKVAQPEQNQDWQDHAKQYQAV